jgi:hypothetical protein
MGGAPGHTTTSHTRTVASPSPDSRVPRQQQNGAHLVVALAFNIPRQLGRRAKGRGDHGLVGESETSDHCQGRELIGVSGPSGLVGLVNQARTLSHSRGRSDAPTLFDQQVAGREERVSEF